MKRRKVISEEKEVLPSMDKTGIDLTYDELVSELHINIHDLDKGFVEQSEFFHKASVIATAMVDKRDRLKDDLELYDSRAALALRDTHERHGEKFTNQSVQDEVSADPGHIELMEELKYYKREVGRWYALKDSYLQRSSMLSNLARLWIANYFSDPSVKDPDGFRSKPTTYKSRNK